MGCGDLTTSLVLLLATHHSRGVAGSGSTFANGKSRNGAFIGYTETRDAGSDAGAVDTAAEVPPWCHDENPADCTGWQRSGECTKNQAYMFLNCKVSCGACTVKRRARARDGPRVFLDVTIGEGKPGRIVLDLFAGTHPRQGRDSPTLHISALSPPFNLFRLLNIRHHPRSRLRGEE